MIALHDKLMSTIFLINAIAHAILVIGGCYYFSLQIRPKFPKKKTFADMGAEMALRYSSLFKENFNYAIYDSAKDKYILYNYDIATGATKLIKTEAFNIKEYHYSVPKQMFVKKAPAPVYKDKRLTSPFDDSDDDVVQLNGLNFDNTLRKFIGNVDNEKEICAQAGVNEEVSLYNYKKFYNVPSTLSSSGNGNDKIIPNVYFNCIDVQKGVLKRCLDDEYFNKGSCKKRRSKSTDGLRFEVRPSAVDYSRLGPDPCKNKSDNTYDLIANESPLQPALRLNGRYTCKNNKIVSAIICNETMVTQTINVTDRITTSVHYPRERFDQYTKSCIQTRLSDLDPVHIVQTHVPYNSMKHSFYVEFDHTDKVKLVQYPGLHSGKNVAKLDGSYFERSGSYFERTNDKYIQKVPSERTIFYHDEPYTMKTPPELLHILPAPLSPDVERVPQTRVVWNDEQTACFTVLGDVILDATILENDESLDHRNPITSYNTFVDDDDFKIDPSFFEFIKKKQSYRYKYFSTSDLYAAGQTTTSIMVDLDQPNKDAEFNRLNADPENIYKKDATGNILIKITKALEDEYKQKYAWLIDMHNKSMESTGVSVQESMEKLHEEIKKIRTMTSDEAMKYDEVLGNLIKYNKLFSDLKLAYNNRPRTTYFEIKDTIKEIEKLYEKMKEIHVPWQIDSDLYKQYADDLFKMTVMMIDPTDKYLDALNEPDTTIAEIDTKMSNIMATYQVLDDNNMLSDEQRESYKKYMCALEFLKIVTTNKEMAQTTIDEIDNKIQTLRKLYADCKCELTTDQINKYNEYIYQLLFNKLKTTARNAPDTINNISEIRKIVNELFSIYKEMKDIRELTENEQNKNEKILQTFNEMLDDNKNVLHGRLQNLLNFEVEIPDEKWTMQNAKKQTDLMKKYYNDLSDIIAPSRILDTSIYKELNTKCENVEQIVLARVNMNNIPSIAKTYTDALKYIKNLNDEYAKMSAIFNNGMQEYELNSDKKNYNEKFNSLSNGLADITLRAKVSREGASDLVTAMEQYKDMFEKAKLNSGLQASDLNHIERITTYRNAALANLDAFTLYADSSYDNINDDIKSIEDLFNAIIALEPPDFDKSKFNETTKKYENFKEQYENLAYQEALNSSNMTDLHNNWNAALSMRQPTTLEKTQYDILSRKFVDDRVKEIAKLDENNFDSLSLQQLQEMSNDIMRDWTPLTQIHSDFLKDPKIEALTSLIQDRQIKVNKQYDDIANFIVDNDKGDPSNMTAAKERLDKFEKLWQDAVNTSGPPDENKKYVYDQKKKKLLELIRNAALAELELYTFKDKERNIADIKLSREKLNKIKNAMYADDNHEKVDTQLTELMASENYVNLLKESEPTNQTELDKFNDRVQKLSKDYRKPVTSELTRINTINENVKTNIDYERLLQTKFNPNDIDSKLERDKFKSEYKRLLEKRRPTQTELTEYNHLYNMVSGYVDADNKYQQLCDQIILKYTNISDAESQLRNFEKNVNLVKQTRLPTAIEQNAIDTKINDMKDDILRLKYSKALSDVNSPSDITTLKNQWNELAKLGEPTSDETRQYNDILSSLPYKPIMDFTVNKTIDLQTQKNNEKQAWDAANKIKAPTQAQTAKHTANENNIENIQAAYNQLYNKIKNYNTNPTVKKYMDWDASSRTLIEMHDDIKKTYYEMPNDKTIFNSKLKQLKDNKEAYMSTYKFVKEYKPKTNFTRKEDAIAHLNKYKQKYEDAVRIRPPIYDESEPRRQGHMATLNEIIRLTEFTGKFNKISDLDKAVKELDNYYRDLSNNRWNKNPEKQEKELYAKKKKEAEDEKRRLHINYLKNFQFKWTDVEAQKKDIETRIEELRDVVTNEIPDDAKETAQIALNMATNIIASEELYKKVRQFRVDAFSQLHVFKTLVDNAKNSGRLPTETEEKTIQDKIKQIEEIEKDAENDTAIIDSMRKFGIFDTDNDNYDDVVQLFRLNIMFNTNLKNYKDQKVFNARLLARLENVKETQDKFIRNLAIKQLENLSTFSNPDVLYDDIKSFSAKSNLIIPNIESYNPKASPQKQK